jgi:hypothetical protein
MSRPRTFAVTTTRRLPFSRLIWFVPFRRETRGSAQRDAAARLSGSVRRSGTGRFERADIVPPRLAEADTHEMPVAS